MRAHGRIISDDILYIIVYIVLLLPLVWFNGNASNSARLLIVSTL